MNKDNNASFFALYKLLAMMGAIERSEDVIPGFRYKDSRVTLALPNAKFGVAFQGDKVSDLIDDGWKIERLTTHDLDPFLRVFDICDNARISLEKRKMDPNVKMTSQPEEVVLHEIMRRMLPMPERNYKFTRDDGTELTTPDFTWENYKIAFFLDGSYWHSIKGNKEIIKKIKSDKKKQNDILIQRSDKARKDGQIRSELGSIGWIVLSCTDGDVETPEGVKRVVDLIERTIENVQISNKSRINNATTKEEDDLFSSLLNPVEESNDDSEKIENKPVEKNNDNKGEEEVSSNSEEFHNDKTLDIDENNVNNQDNQYDKVHELDPEPLEDNLEKNDIDNEDSDKNANGNKKDLKGSIFDYIGDYDYEETEINAEDTNNYSPLEEEKIDVNEIVQTDINAHAEIPNKNELVKNKEDDKGIEDKEYDLLDDVFLDDDLEDIFFLNDEKEE